MSEAFNGDVCVYYETVGPPDRPLVILVAGLGEQIGSVEFSDEQAERFVQAGLRVARLDNRDAGLSTSFDGAGRPVLDDLFAAVFAGETVAVPYSHADMAGDIVAVADALHATEFHLVGTSLGGFLVRWAAVRHPDRVASLTVVMSGAGAYPGEVAPQLEMSTINDLVTEAEHRSREEYIAFKVELSRRMWGNFAFDENWVRRHVAGAYDRSYRPDGVYRQVIAGFISAGLWTAQRAIPAPTLVMHGSLDDVFTVDHAEATTSQIPGARLWVVKDMGHSMPPELWDDMVDRVSELASAS